MDELDATDTYFSVKVIVTKDNVETVYDIPMVCDFSSWSEYDEPEIRPLNKRPPRREQTTRLLFAMRPIGGKDGTYMTMEQTTLPKEVALKDIDMFAIINDRLKAKGVILYKERQEKLQRGYKTGDWSHWKEDKK